MSSTYDLRLVVLSFIIAVIASYTALALAGRVRSADGKMRVNWLLGGAIAMGTGIWSMHFIAMLAFNLSRPVTYDVLTTLVSLLDAILASSVALLLVSRPSVSPLRLLSSSVLMGLAIASMHYIGMAGMQVDHGTLHYNLLIVVMSVEIAIYASFGALWLAFRLRDETVAILNWRKLGSALFMGVAISGMHYTGMAAASFFERDGLTAVSSYAFDASLLATAIGAATLVILGLTLITSLFDQKLATQLTREEALQESEKRFRMLIREMPIGVLLVEPSLKIIQSNQAAINLLGLTDSHLLGQQMMTSDLLLLCEDGTPFAQENLPMQQAIATRMPVHNVVIGINHSTSQEPRWLLTNADPQLASNGSVERIVCTFSDITPTKQAESALRQSEAREREKATQLELAMKKLKQTQVQLIQTEKMFSLGQVVAGVAHEINNPVNFIYANIAYASEYTHDLLDLLHLYSQHYPNPAPDIQERQNAIDLNFVTEDLPKLLDSMNVGAERILRIVLSLRNFSRHDEAAIKWVDIHSGIDNTLLLLQNQLKATETYQAIEVVKEYSNLPMVECYPGQLNQVFMNIISNAIDALEEKRSKSQGITSKESDFLPCIWIRTLWQGSHCPEEQTTLNGQQNTDRVVIQIVDNGSGMTEAVKAQLFDPFFTTKTVGKGIGIGLSISYQIIVEKHGGVLMYDSEPGQGTNFYIKIPVHQNPQQSTGHLSLLDTANSGEKP
ncbi:MAG: ATP-binding protein [Cyanobacteriota bacterium]|nr:ATP-binding protein [Cyanobacteriota bacterium]